jgi:hypothetical protein
MAYWTEGKMPEKGTICPGEFGPFQKRSWPETLKALADGEDLTKNVTISARKWLESYYT